MAKNIVLCLDGTGNQLGLERNTNVVHLYQMLDLRNPEDQIAFYDPGVGTFGAQGAVTPLAQWATRMLGLIIGYGLRTNLGEAYTYLMKTYEPGDRVYIFGFSRGAYTARALCGMLCGAGLLRPGAENLVPYALKVYARKKREWTNENQKTIDEFRRVFASPSGDSGAVPIHFLGVWDSVKAAGVLRWTVSWRLTRELTNVRTACHAVSINEKRRIYREYLIFPKDGRPELKEVWFAGVHSDIGGTFKDDSRLAKIALKWMTDQAISAGLVVRPKIYQDECRLTEKDALAKVHRAGPFWKILTYRIRPISGALLHYSVRVRIERDSSYALSDVESCTWDDPEWHTLREV